VVERGESALSLHDQSISMEIMKSVEEEVLFGIIEQLLDRGYIDLERFFVVGTRIGANSLVVRWLFHRQRAIPPAQPGLDGEHPHLTGNGIAHRHLAAIPI
jgi:hypothetical protein